MLAVENEAYFAKTNVALFSLEGLSIAVLGQRFRRASARGNLASGKCGDHQVRLIAKAVRMRFTSALTLC
jgi:hypothetical protein